MISPLRFATDNRNSMYVPLTQLYKLTSVKNTKSYFSSEINRKQNIVYSEILQFSYQYIYDQL